MNNIIRYTPADVLAQYYPIILQLMLVRMKENKTSQYCRLFIHSISIMVSTLTPERVYASLESIQIGMMGMIVTQIVASSMDILLNGCDEKELKEIIIGWSSLMNESPINEQPPIWGELLKILLHLVNPSDGSTRRHGSASLDLSLLEDDDTLAMEFDSTYSKLAFAQVAEPYHESQTIVGNDVLFAQQLGKLCASRPGRYVPLLTSILSEAQVGQLQTILQTAGVALV